MSQLSAWMSATRPRTLPLALSSSLMGSLAAFHDGRFRWSVFGLSLLTTLFLQILSNLANDYGDSVNGADNEQRVGPARAVQSGAIPLKTMKRAVALFSLLAFVAGVALIAVGLGFDRWLPWLIFLGAGLLAIAAAIFYTAGSKPYGYKGYGDLFVFLFFGITAVVGTYYLHARTVNFSVLLPASTIGFLSTAVLNLNNMRDAEGDALAGKRTLVVVFGSVAARYYHFTIVILALLSMVMWNLLHDATPRQYLFLLITPLLVIHLRNVALNKTPALLDPQLRVLAFSTLLLVLLFGLGLHL